MSVNPAGVWTRTVALPPPSGAPLVPKSVAEFIMPLLADNATGQISARDLRDSFDLVISLFGDSAGVAPFDPTKNYKATDLVSVTTGVAPNQQVQIFAAVAPIAASPNIPGAAGARDRKSVV